MKGNKVYKLSLILTLTVFTIFYVKLFPVSSGGIYSASEFGSDVLHSDYFPPFSSLIYNATRESTPVNSSDQEPSQKQGFGFGTAQDNSRRLFVFLVLPNSPAERAGLKQNDEILKIDNIDVKNLDELEVNKTIDGKDSINLSVARSNLKESINIEIKKDTVNLPDPYNALLNETKYMPGIGDYSSSPDYSYKVTQGLQDVINNAEYDVELSRRAIVFGALIWGIIELISLFLILKVLKWSVNFKGKLQKTRGLLLTILSIFLIPALLVFASYFFPLFHTLIKMGESLEGGWIDLSDLIFAVGFFILVVINLSILIPKFYKEKKIINSISNV